MRITTILLALSLLGMLSSCKDKKVKQGELTPQKVEITETPKPEPEVQKAEEVKPVVRQSNYYVVAGCFRIKSNADRLHSKLISQGYDSRIIPFYDMHMVTYNGYNTHREAQVALNRIVCEPGKEYAWVYPVK